MDPKILDWYNKNSHRKYPFQVIDDLIPNDLIVDGIINSEIIEIKMNYFYFNENNILKIEFSDGSLLELNVNEYTIFERADIYKNNINNGFLIFGNGINNIYTLFSKQYNPNACIIEPSIINVLPNIVLSLNKTNESKIDTLVGDIKLTGNKGIHITKVSDGFIFSAFYEEDECAVEKTNCLKSINNVLPDENGNIILEGENLLYFSSKTNGLYVNTILNREDLCLTRFDDGTKGDPGIKGDKGPRGPTGACIYVSILCCECEVCDRAESCLTCEIGDTCKTCDECEICNTCENEGGGGGCGQCELCEAACDIFDSPCLTCNECEVCNECEICNACENE